MGSFPGCTQVMKRAGCLRHSPKVSEKFEGKPNGMKDFWATHMEVSSPKTIKYSFSAMEVLFL
ncbi:MAG: hypothetical protein A3C06_04235 [Candidatus Taylorbacteria bacterium RIFCSPHIGHO2_02_FULL_46_13]|uniref:Uncharacterized protein n=1 Tax=Candidatus Taylorbacteria bacterium RIFCSPHIGHO2_02_FULL_46_13 TaxID=1802312 RepID=A0A1G2MU34_9BACT|nr:MAG: hypothetical protein A3C06_04235 [Candidatus Taylorbacteria bacterium RIFCSPHIGHO2_02_FULL_46_13]